jgi:hypothetical protein
LTFFLTDNKYCWMVSQISLPRTFPKMTGGYSRRGWSIQSPQSESVSGYYSFL